ncbi:hypothetical protein GGR52DRAFT_574613 [Hypoxylon sp. FL1284]|nr:hypothetical protein GGR52DRAFT_574613 [Hypoxylon sp. FL1284]
MTFIRSWPTPPADQSRPPPSSEYQEARMVEPPARTSSRAPQAPVPTVGLFPLSWSLYRTLSFSRVLMLGPREDEPMYAVSRHAGWWSRQPDLVLHRGPSDAHPTLASGTGGVGVGRHSIVALPALPGSRLGSATELLLRSADGVAMEKTRPARFRFAIEVGPDTAVAWRREVFEWRRSRSRSRDGDDNDDECDGIVTAFLDGAASGWKLVRLAENDSNGRSKSGGRRCRLVWPRSGDGSEVVAVWSRVSRSLRTVLKFRFLGSGATGVLGERWAIMAVVTALRMYQRQQHDCNGIW